MKKLPLSLLFAAMTLAGCASTFNPVGDSEFSCPGMPQGVICKTPRAVYKSTNGPLPVTDSDLPITSAKAGDKPAERLSSDTPLLAQGNVPYRTGTTAALPVREAPKVMRIYIAPWVDSHDDLHLASVFYTEIEPRKWSIGIREDSGRGVVVPFREVPTDTATSPAAPAPPQGTGVAASQAAVSASASLPVPGFNLDQPQ